MEKITLHAKILTPICVSTGTDRDGLDFFIDEQKHTFCLVDQEWIERAIEEKQVNAEELLNAIKKGEFKTLSKIKQQLGKEFFKIKKKYKIWKDAMKTLWQQGNSSNQGIVKQQFKNPFTNEVMIPWSTIKGILRTAYLYDKFWEENQDSADNAKKFDSINGELNERLFKWIGCEDVVISNAQVEIQTIQSKNKPQKPWLPPKKWIYVICESLISWECDITLSIAPNNWKLDRDLLSRLEEILGNYSECLIWREEKIMDWIDYGHELLDELDNECNQWNCPIKLWMYKKSLTYKLWWEELIQTLPHWKARLTEARKKGVGDKTLYIDEYGYPVGWIVLSFPKK